MLSELLLFVALGVGQTDALPSESIVVPLPKVETTPAPERWQLMKALQGTYPGWLIDGNGLRVYGWTEGSFTASSAANDNLPLGLNYRANEYLVQQNWLRVEKPVVTSGNSEPTFGFRSDSILPGTDYRFTLPRGFLNGQLIGNDGSPNTYGIDLVQLYGEAYFPSVAKGMDLKIGRMFCQYGYESVDAPANALASHSYTAFYNPFTQTGVLATIQLDAAWSAQVGGILGPDVVFDPAASPYGVFSIKWAPPNGQDSVLISSMVGSGRYDVDEQFNNPNIIDLVYTHTIDSRLSYALDALFGYQTNVPNIGSTWWFGAVNYLTYKFSPRTSGTARLEFFDDADGNRTGFPGWYTSMTAGLNFKPWPSLIIRPELRFDYNNESRPFEGKQGLATAVTDIVIRW